MTTFGELGFGEGAFGGLLEFLPELLVEVAFDTDPLDPSPVWTDITDWVYASESTTVRRGRSSPTDDVQPGTLSLTLDNSDGRFTAGLASSPYYPNVTINRRIRLRATWDGVTYPVFDGHVDRWPMSWTSETAEESRVRVSATDRMKLLARRPIRTPLEEEVLRDSPVAFWPLTEQSDAESAGDVSRADGVRLVPVDGKNGAGEFEFGADWRMLHSTTARFAYADSPGDLHHTVLQGDTSVVPLTPPYSYEFWYIVTAPTPGTIGSSQVAFLVVADERGERVRVTMGADGVLNDGNLMATVFPAGPTGGISGGASDPTDTDDGFWHHCVLTVAADGVSVSLYRDGAVVGSGTASAALNLNPVRYLWLGGALIGPMTYRPLLPLNGRMARVAIYDTELTADRVLEHYNMGQPSFTELSSDRIERLAAYAGIPTGTIETGMSYVSADQDTAGKGVHEALLDVARSETGLVFLDGEGQVTFHSRAHRRNQAVDLTLDADTGEVDADLEFELSDALTVNDITVDRPRGGPVRTVDQDSVDTLGTYAEQVGTLLTSDDETRSYGEWQLSRRASPAPRAGRVSVDPFADSSLYPAALGTELGSRVQITNLPATAPAATVDLVVEGVEHTFSMRGWSTSWDTSPADTATYVEWDAGTWDSDRWAW